MKRIMLVDDEILTRESIRNCVDWIAEGFIYCGDAADGEMALPLIAEWQPQILITDIKMPFMDGLELASIVRKTYPQIKIIVLSGHDEFQYAQQAIRIGVEDYCLKPVGSRDLIALLQKVSKQIDAEQQKNEVASYSKEKLLADLCGGLVNTSRALDIATNYNLSLIARYYAVVAVELTFTNSDSADNVQYFKLAEQALSDCFQGDIEALSYRPSRSELIYIIKGNSYEQLQVALTAFPQLANNYLTSLSCIAALGIGSIQQRLQSLHTSYLEAIDEKNKQRLSQQTQLEAHSFLTDATIGQPIINREKFIEFIKIGTVDQLESFLQSFCKDMEQLAWNTSMYGIYLLNELTLEAFHTAKLSFPVSHNDTGQLADMQQRVKGISNIEQCKQYLSGLITLLWQWRAVGSNQYSELIIKVKQYIGAHYHNNQLSLQDVSRHVGVSPSHLSKVFSQETKQTLTEYITQTRIYKAMELLKTTRLKTFEIAFEVGYQDQHYFSNIFKKTTGMTPIEFRKQGSLLEESALYTTGGAS